ncbi:MAG: hypothetical protein JO001_19960 [Alphaproteobacteria bacterium]|nr:hypothetical protein [Alphaproteobacteria bacterium]
MRTVSARLGQEIDAIHQERRSRGLHQSFLTYRGFRYLKIAALLCLVSLAIYIADNPYGSPYGGSWAGYTLGTVGAALIFWLTWFGYRKRNYPVMQDRLAARLSAHIYFGLALVIIATLHTGFHFGWNIHTVAYGLMCFVIASGVVGVYCYSRYPRMMTANRAGMTMQQMLGRIASLDDEMRTAAMPLDERMATAIELAAENTAIGGSAWRQMSGHYPSCATAAAIALLDRRAEMEGEAEEGWLRVRVLLEEKAVLLARVRQDISYKAILDFWLYLHVPLTIMLVGALLAHIISVFFLW